MEMLDSEKKHHYPSLIEIREEHFMLIQDSIEYEENRILLRKLVVSMGMYTCEVEELKAAITDIVD